MCFCWILGNSTGLQISSVFSFTAFQKIVSTGIKNDFFELSCLPGEDLAKWALARSCGIQCPVFRHIFKAKISENVFERNTLGKHVELSKTSWFSWLFIVFYMFCLTVIVFKFDDRCFVDGWMYYSKDTSQILVHLNKNISWK